MPLSNDDLNKISNLLKLTENRIKSYVDEQLKETASDLPSKNDFFDRTDQILGNQRKNNQELELVSAKVSNHEEGIQNLEAKKS